MFVKLKCPEDVTVLYNKLCEQYVEYTDRPDYHVSIDINPATQTYPVIVFVENDLDGYHTFIKFPNKVRNVEEL